MEPEWAVSYENEDSFMLGLNSIFAFLKDRKWEKKFIFNGNCYISGCPIKLTFAYRGRKSIKSVLNKHELNDDVWISVLEYEKCKQYIQ